MIRYATTDDLNILNEFLNYFSKSYVLDKDFLEHPFSRYVLLEEYGEKIGFMSFSKIYDRLELEYIYVKDNYRNKGYASKLMEFLIEEALKENSINITLEVCELNEKAINLYKKYGFAVVAKREKYYENSDGYVMIRKM